jgi:hypothetical protein
MKTIDDDIRKIEELEDGSSVYEIGKLPEEENPENSFYDNLAKNFPEEARKKLATFLLEAIEEDIESRKEWMESVEKVKQYLGFSLEDLKNVPFKEATRTFDTTLSTALIRFYATTRAELLPQTGPAGFKINGTNNEQLTSQGEKIRDWLNYYLTMVDKSYYSDFERFLLYLGLYGSGFKKVYYDKLLKRPLSRFIMPHDFIIDSDCTSILESNRLTHVLHLSKREIILNQQNNIYLDVELPYLKTLEIEEEELNKNTKKNKDEIDLDVYTKRSLFPIYEVHTYLNLDDFKNDGDSKTEDTVPLPYIVTIDKISKEILSIRKNWKENDPEQKRKNFFVQYNYLPGFGIYGIGLAHLIGSNAITLTKLLRQLVDAGSFKNLPGGLRAKGFKQQQNDIIVGPGQFVEVDTGGIPLQEAFMPLPYSEPSNSLRELRIEIMNQTKELGSTSEMGMLDSKEDIPTGTTLALLETNNRIQSSVLRSIHYSLTEELQLINQIFKENLDTEEFLNNGQQEQISGNDFIDEVKIIPVSDPVMNSTPQRIMRAESVLRVSQQDPQVHNMRAVFEMVYKAQGLDEKDIENILKPDQEPEVMPVDPITEFTNILLGKPVKAAMWQNHPAHILVLGTSAQRPEIQSNPGAQAALQALITEHQTYQYILEMQQLLGFELPPPEQLQDPEIQNAIALGLAQKLEESGATESRQEAPVNPTVLMAQAQENETAARERIANLKAETDVFKAQLDFEKEKAKIESNEDIAKLKSETELLKQENQNVY